MTYQPGLNGGRINATIGGNTAGAGALASTGTVTLAGGNNITLSQAGNAITISGGAAGGLNVGMSNIGNSSGTSGTVSNQMIFAGGNNVTLSQSTGAGGNTMTISAANQTAQTQSIITAFAASGFSTGGTMETITSGSLFLYGDYVTQSHGSITMRAVSPYALSAGITNIGNTAGAGAFLANKQLFLAGGNNITLSNTTGTDAAFGLSQTITISAANQTVQTQNMFVVNDGAATISSGTAVLSDANNFSFGINGQTITGSVAANLSVGVSTGGNSLGNSGVASNTVVFAGGNNITLSQNTGAGGNTITIQAPNLGTAAQITTISQYQHNSAAMYSSSSSAMVNTSVSLARMIIPSGVSFSRVDIPVSISGGTSATANTAAVALSAVGVIYSRNASTLNAIVGQSSTTTYSYASNTGVYSSLTGPRVMSFNLATSLSAGEYYFGFQLSSNTSSIGTATTAPGFTLAPIFGSSYTVLPWQDMSAATNQTINLYQPLQGMNSVSISNTSQTHQQSQITQSGATAIRANLIIGLRNS